MIVAFDQLATTIFSTHLHIHILQVAANGKLRIAAHGHMWVVYIYIGRTFINRVHGRFYGFIGIWWSSRRFRHDMLDRK